MSCFEFEQIFLEVTVGFQLVFSSSVFFLKAWRFGTQWSELPGQVKFPPVPEVTGLEGVTVVAFLRQWSLLLGM